MIAKIFSATVLGMDAHLIEVEVDVTVGMNVFNIVGLPDCTIKESRDRKYQGKCCSLTSNTTGEVSKFIKS